ncbi:MAG TPA: peptidyl-prolyl cis-trans isomerase [Niallia sp.]|nr:peptidyl-prolyl cis-trans isomerase [Niallia sp.]
MNSIIQVSGLVKFPITIDPTVWIFDDRKLSEDVVFLPIEEKDELEDYTIAASKHWDREITEGAKAPVKQVYKKVEMITGTFYMPLSPFITNAEPVEDANALVVTTSEENITIPLSRLQDIYLLFCVKGKPLTNDGPVHLYFRSEGKNQNPIKNIRSLQII